MSVAVPQESSVSEMLRGTGFTDRLCYRSLLPGRWPTRQGLRMTER